MKNTSDIIAEAMNFTIKRQKRKVVIKFSIGPKNVSQVYSLRVFYTGINGWSVSINRKKYAKVDIDASEDVLAEIVSRKWQLILVFDEADYGPLEEI